MEVLIVFLSLIVGVGSRVRRSDGRSGGVLSHDRGGCTGVCLHTQHWRGCRRYHRVTYLPGGDQLIAISRVVYIITAWFINCGGREVDIVNSWHGSGG